MDYPWRFELFGGLGAQRGPLRITRFATSRIAALLARLCLFPHQTHPREELIDLLWPDADFDAGRNSLRVALASLRRQIEPPGTPSGSVLLADRSAVRLSAPAVQTDVAEFQAALAVAAQSSDMRETWEALDTAMALFKGELLPGFYDDWIVDERARLNALYEDAVRQRERLGPLAAPASFAAAKVSPEPENVRLPGFPLSFTRFFGREQDCAAATATLQAAETRLLTLTGPGGAGKTRLAVEAAHQAASGFPGPVCWVPLADLSQASLIPDAIAQALALPSAPSLEPLAHIATALNDQPPGLLVLDNFEQLVEGGAPLLFSLLSRVPHLTCLVTSRRRLGLPGEIGQAVAPLPLPDSQATLDQISVNAGVQLFVDRAQAARPDFQLTRANAESVALLCCTLEGIPLALELVAARALALTPAQMTERLSRRFSLPAGRRGDDPGGRHGSLWTAMAWSYDLIPPSLQHFFAGLSVFRGGCTPEAAAAVCAEPGALECLTQLRERSLVMLEDGPGGVRFRLLETLREYAASQLEASGEAETLRARHRDFFLALAEDMEPKLMGQEGAVWLARMTAERENLRAALDHCLGDNTAEGAEAGLRLAGAMGRFWQTHGELVQGRERLETMLSHPQADTPTLARASAMRWAGLLAFYQGDYPAARAWSGEALTLFRALGEARGSGWAHLTLGNVAANRGERGEAEAHFEQALAMFRISQDARGIGGVLNNLGSLLVGQGELTRAKPLFEEALALLQKAGHWSASAIMLTNLGTLAYYQKDLSTARRSLEKAQMLRTEMGTRNDQSAYALVILAGVSRAEGKNAEAAMHLAEGLAACRENGDKTSGVNLLEFTAILHFAVGKPQQAARTMGAAARLREESGAVQDKLEQAEYETYLAGVRSSLKPSEFSAAWAAGRALTWEQAVNEALHQMQTASAFSSD